MFKFHKVRGPEEVGEAIGTMEETANRLESMLEIAQKEKSRLNLLVGNVTDRFEQIKQSAAGFDDVISKIDSFQNQFKHIESELGKVQTQTDELKGLKNETANLFEQFKLLKVDLENSEAKIKEYDIAAKQVDVIKDKTNDIKTNILPGIEAIYQKQTELLEGYNSFAERLDKAESKLHDLVKLSDEFKKTSASIAQESARVSTWMEATESMSTRLQQATEVFETTRQKVDRLHELAEYVESKSKALTKQKELLKKAHLESGRANGLFWEIKSKLNELERDAEKIRDMEMRTGEFDRSVKLLEKRFDQIGGFSKKVDQLLADYARLDQYAMQLHEHRKQLGIVNDLAAQIAKHVEMAGEERTKLAEAEKQIGLFIKRSEESQNESRSIIRQLTELMQNAEKFLQRAPDVGKILTQIEAARKRSLALENKLMEVMATAADIKNESQNADEIKQKVDQFNHNAEQKIAAQKKDLAQLNDVIVALKNDLEAVRANWSQVPQLMNKIAEIEKSQDNLDKTYKSVMQREQTIVGLKNLMEQNNVAFKEFEKTSAEIHQKATEILNVKSELENIDYQVKSFSTEAQKLSMMGERIEKTEIEMNGLSENFAVLNRNAVEWKTRSEEIKTECDEIRKTHENLHTNIGEVMDLFTRLAELRQQAEKEAENLNKHFHQTGLKMRELGELNGRSVSESGKHVEKLNEIKESINVLNAGQDELIERFNSIEAESAKITNLANTIKEKQIEMSSLEEKIAILEGKLSDAESMQRRVTEFEKTFEQLKTDMKEAGAALSKIEKINREFETFRETITHFEQKIASIGDKVKIVDKLKTDLNRATLMAEELKARQNSLKDEKDLINKAVAASARLEELVYRAEHITEKKE